MNESTNNSDQINYFVNNLLSDYSSSEKLIYISILILIFFLIKNVFTIFNTKIISNYLLFFTAELQQKLFEKFINLNYTSLLKKNSEKYIRDITIESRLIVNSYLSPIFQIIINLLTVLFFTILLLIYDLKNTIILISILLISSLLIIFILKPLLFKFGLIRQDTTSKIIGYIKQTFDGIRELKIDNSANFYLKDFKKNIEKLASTGVKRAIFGILPRITFELLLVTLFVFFIIFSVKSSADLNETILTVTIFGASALRIIPSITGIIRSYQKVTYAKSAVETIKKIFNEKNETQNVYSLKNDINKNLNFDSEIELKNISFKYEKKEILKNLNLKIYKNVFYGIKGETGSGKSTLVDILCGLLEPSSGSILIDGIDVKLNKSEWRNKISYIQQNPYIFNITLAQNIALNKDNNTIDIKKINDVVLLAGLEDFVDNLENGVSSLLLDKGMNISGGQKQKISIARSLYKNKEIIILDESLSNLDKLNKIEILKALSKFKNKKTLIMISHDEDCLEYADKIIQLKDKKISYEV